MISVIVPVYNIEKYLPKCLDSILNQSVCEWEAWLIDDGSTDKSGDICDRYANLDHRFKVVHQSNQGLPAARNTGLRNVKGDYISFIDGDDFIHPDFLKFMIKALTDNNADITICGVETIPSSDKNTEFLFPHPHYEVNFLTQDECISSLFYIHKKYTCMAVWDKVFSRKIIDGLFFENTTCEDVEFLSRVYQRIKKAVRINTVLYYYVKRPGSITWEKFNIRNCGEIDTMLRVLNNLDKNQEKARALCLQQLFTLIPAVKNFTKKTAFYEEAKANCHNALKISLFSFLKNLHIPFIRKLGLLTFIFIPFSYDWYSRFNRRPRTLDTDIININESA